MKIDRKKVYEKCDGHCGYCGKKIEFKQMQVDHIVPKWMHFHHLKNYDKDFKINDFKNLMPSCRSCNHYKREKNLEQFREYMIALHERVEKNYINKVAIDYGIISLQKFDGVFFFEKYASYKEYEIFNLEKYAKIHSQA